MTLAPPSQVEKIVARLTARGSSTIQITEPVLLARVPKLAQSIFLKAVHAQLSYLVPRDLRFADDVHQSLYESPLPVALYSSAKQEILQRTPSMLGKMQAYSTAEMLDVAVGAAAFLSPSEEVLRKMAPALAEWFGGEAGPSEKAKSHNFTTRKGGGGSCRIISFRKPQDVLALTPAARRVVLGATRKWAVSNHDKKLSHALDHEQSMLFQEGAASAGGSIAKREYMLMLFMLDHILPMLPQSSFMQACSMLGEHVATGS